MEGINFNGVVLLTKEVPVQSSLCVPLCCCCPVSVWGFGVHFIWLCCRSARGAVVRFVLTAVWGWVTPCRGCILQQRPRSLAFLAATRLVPTGPGRLDLGR